ncbi:MAG: hypothetical protein H7841_03445 [Magnetospirillum sp. WYHS-4]
MAAAFSKTDYQEWVTIAEILIEAMRQRCNVYRGFAPEISRRYWDSESLHVGKAREGIRRLLPPWNGRRRTVTLTLDLRKSTFAMREADSPKHFACWMDVLLTVLSTIVRQNLGVFDKFTGDGIIVHFLDEEVRELKKESPVTVAVRCAGALIAAVECLLKDLREFLHHDRADFGAGVGISVADAHWRLDHTQNPIVVGRGVVEACRLSDSAKAGIIQMSGNAYHELAKDLRACDIGGEKVPYASKDIAEDSEVRIWRLTKLPCPLAPDIDEVARICDGCRKANDCNHGSAS